MIFEQSNNRDFYLEYHRMGHKAFRDKVRYYEDHRSLIGYLSYEERIDVDLDYILCVFEIGKYHKFLSKCDSLIEVVIMDNIFSYNGLNIYNDLLFKKAACLFNTGQYLKSEKVLKSIIKLEPDNSLARSLYGKCKRKQGRDWYEGAKALSMVMLISAVSIAFMELLVVRPFYDEYVSTFAGLKIFFFGTGIITLISNELYLSYVIGREIGYKVDLDSIKSRWKAKK